MKSLLPICSAFVLLVSVSNTTHAQDKQLPAEKVLASKEISKTEGVFHFTEQGPILQKWFFDGNESVEQGTWLRIRKTQGDKTTTPWRCFCPQSISAFQSAALAAQPKERTIYFAILNGNTDRHLLSLQKISFDADMGDASSREEATLTPPSEKILKSNRERIIPPPMGLKKKLDDIYRIALDFRDNFLILDLFRPDTAKYDQRWVYSLPEKTWRKAEK